VVLGFKVVWVTEVAMDDVMWQRIQMPRASKGGRRTSGTLVQGHVRTPRGPGLTSRL
jgi:hypothetical protein